MSKGIQLKDADGNVYPRPYLPIGFVYISVSNVNPSTYFGGTWKQITGDAYLKIVTSNADQFGGTSSDHKIPISSIPAHNHQYRTYDSNGSNYEGIVWNGYAKNTYSTSRTTENRGGGQAYYPYYFGVYVFVRTA